MHTSLSHLVWTSVVVWPSSYDKELAGTAGHGRRANSLFHGSHLCPAVGEAVITLHAAQAALPIIATYSVDLRADTQTRYEIWELNYREREIISDKYVPTHTMCTETQLYSSLLVHRYERQHLENRSIRCRKKGDVRTYCSFICKHYPRFPRVRVLTLTFVNRQ